MTNIKIPGTIDETSLQLPPRISYEEWAKVGKTLGELRIATSWAIGDWLIFGEHTYGEKFAQAASETGMQPESLKVYQWVASCIPREIRRTDVSHAHHQLVARLEPEEIQTWLDRSSKKGWTVAELRAALREKLAKQAKKKGQLEKFPKFKVALEFIDDPGEEYLTKLEAYVSKESGTVRKAGW